MFDEKIKKKVGDTIVEGTVESVKSKLDENIDIIIPPILKIAAVALGINVAFNFVNRPRTNTTNMHLYIHIV